MNNISDTLEPKEVDIPSKYETFEAQVVIKTQPHKETIYPYVMPTTHPLAEAYRVIKSGRFHADLLLPQLVGKPALIITEDAPRTFPYPFSALTTEPPSMIDIYERIESVSLLRRDRITDFYRKRREQRKEKAGKTP